MYKLYIYVNITGFWHKKCLFLLDLGTRENIRTFDESCYFIACFYTKYDRGHLFLGGGEVTPC